MKKVIYLCGRCKLEFDGYLEEKPKICPDCGFDKIYISYKHRRFSRKSRPKVRWAFKIH
ncbi:MAG: hypothetical protein HZC46_10660 [Ignavibacterium album]|uniref:hypothetical protein n=1 Tax=Ignavibacterium album TaxID=591197 RepID=UPI0026EA138B|nr:hypothetical protein [Ignavibacterium album]MBI5662595.1 hypothetical protein [Ignavibacterium album]